MSRKEKNRSIEDEIQENLKKNLNREFNVNQAEVTQVSETKKEPKKTKKKKISINKHIAIVSYSSMFIFVLLISYLIYFLGTDHSEMLSNPYNRTQDLLAERVERGKIVSSDGEVLAETLVNKDGEEVRSYPYDNLFAHVVGHFDNGKTGLESAFNIYMLTSDINPIIAAIDELRGLKSPGNRVVTTLDVGMQKVAYQALGSYRGAVIVMDPENGEIIAMVSKPDYDPNKISSNWDSLLKDDSGNSALLNRATQGLYPPGSTFKLVTLLEYIRENKGYGNYEYYCDGLEKHEDATINCYNKKKHGTEDLEKAFSKSCNSSFASIGLELDLASYKKLCDSLLFNSALPYAYEYKRSSFVLDSDASASDIMQTAIGQGKTMISPLHNALLTCAVANGGYLVTPHLVRSIETHQGDHVKSFSYNKGEQIFTKKEAKVLSGYMQSVVKDGTATLLANRGYEAAGKTGSAEFNSSKSSHAWFIGYAKKDGKTIAVSIIVEAAGTGSDYAVPIAKKIFDAYY